MAEPLALPVACLRAPCDPAQFTFATTAELADPAEPFGQARAVQAVRFALEVGARGYNLFVLGNPGSSRHETVRRLLQEAAATRAAPDDWCYVYHFAQPNRPRALRLPAGQGERLRAGMHGFVGEVGKAIEAAFDSDEYRARVEAIHKEFKTLEAALLQALASKAGEQGVALLHTPQGFAFAPLKDGTPMNGEQVDALTEEERSRLGTAMEALREELTHHMQQLPRLRRQMQTRIREASRDAMALAAGHLIDELKESFAALPQVCGFLDEVLRDVVEAGEQLREQPRAEDEEIGGFTGSLSLVRYEVNLLLGHAADGHAPVHACDNPTFANLMGRIDHMAHMGALLTNFTLIQPGALHQANGGYLMLDLLQLLAQPYAWDGLKRALRNGQIVIESLPQALGWASTLPLEPEPIAAELKVVLFGQREHYYLLQQLDPEFDELFKVAADFEDDAPRDAPHTAACVALLGTLARQQGLRPLSREGAARMIEQASRLADDAGRLCTRTRPLNDLLREADAQAARAGRAVITDGDVVEALAAAVQRVDRLRDTLHDAVLKGTLRIATDGEQLGQVNGLAVTELGEFRFGRPVRITATVRLGDGQLVDILRESHLGQPLHSKGVLILGAYLGARYACGLPLSLQASLVFEQTYGPVEGDSASLAEACALLSALAALPVRQALAVTGSIDQFGQVQAIGGVNEKIEGFFDVCVARGLTGGQGVLVPQANRRHLMLREDVVAAVAAGRFAVYAVEHVDQAIALLTGVPAGSVQDSGPTAAPSVNGRVAARLEQFSRNRQAFGSGQGPHGGSRHARRAAPRPEPEA